MMKFKHGMQVKYRHTQGWIDFIDESYFTICFLDIPDKTKHNGRYQASILVYREHWNEVCSCVDEAKEKQEGETTSYFLQSRGCDHVGAAC
jgi:hypothetical protein